MKPFLPVSLLGVFIALLYIPSYFDCHLTTETWLDLILVDLIYYAMRKSIRCRCNLGVIAYPASGGGSPSVVEGLTLTNMLVVLLTLLYTKPMSYIYYCSTYMLLPSLDGQEGGKLARLFEIFAMRQHGAVKVYQFTLGNSYTIDVRSRGSLIAEWYWTFRRHSEF